MTEIKDLIAGKLYRFKNEGCKLYYSPDGDSNIVDTIELKTTDLFMYIGLTTNLMMLLKHELYYKNICIFLFKDKYCTHNLSASKQELEMISI